MAELKTPLEAGESVVRHGRANLQRGAEAVGGWLALTDRRLIFESHKLNVQSGPEVILLDDVTGVRKAWTKFLGAVPLFPNTLAVTTRDGSEHCLVLNKRSAWLEEIDAARGA